MLVILLILFILITVVAIFLTARTKENYGGTTLGPWGYHYIPNEFVYPQYEYTYEDGKYAYFFDEIGDMWKAKLPINGPPKLEHAG